MHTNVFYAFYVMPCRKADRILYYNYTIDYIERNVTREVTTRVYKCPPAIQESHKWYVKQFLLMTVRYHPYAIQ